MGGVSPFKGAFKDSPSTPGQEMELRANLVNPSVGETLLPPHRNESSGHKSATSFAIYMWTLNDPLLGNNETGRVVKYIYIFFMLL